MYGWEFPPNNVGGLGTACHGLTKGLVEKGADVVFVLPSGDDIFCNSLGDAGPMESSPSRSCLNCSALLHLF